MNLHEPIPFATESAMRPPKPKVSLCFHASFLEFSCLLNLMKFQMYDNYP